MKRKTVLIVSVAAVAVFAAVLLYRYLDRQSMIDCVLTWGRLSEFPDAIQNFEIKTEGSMFTRAFRASFTASPEVISEWFSASPGIKDAEQEHLSPGRIRYLIKPGGGAQHAEVEFDKKKNMVKIYVYWS